MRKNTSNLKKKQKQSLEIGEKTIKEDINKPRRNMHGQVMRVEKIKTAWNWRTRKTWANYFKSKGFCLQV